MLDPKLTNENYSSLKTDSEIFFSQYITRRKKSIDITKLLGKK